jgi:hypothetical protein
MPDHGLWENYDGSVDCGCGMHFANGWDALDHSLPIAIAELLDARKADPTSTPEQIAKTEDLLRRSQRGREA